MTRQNKYREAAITLITEEAENAGERHRLTLWLTVTGLGHVAFLRPSTQSRDQCSQNLLFR